MKYLLDTCVISELAKKSAHPKVIEWITACNEDLLFLSVLTIGEIQKGISKIKDLKKKNKIQLWLDSDLKERFSNKILPISEEVALTWGIVQGEAESKGNTIPAIDGLMGATAIVHNLIAVTRNELDIKKTGARVLNPWKL